MGYNGTALAVGALGNAVSDTFKGMAEGEEKAPQVEAQTLASQQARSAFPLEQQIRQGQAGHLQTSIAESPHRIGLMTAQAQHLLRPEPLNTPYGVYSHNWQTGQATPLVVPHFEHLPGGFTKVVSPTGDIAYKRELTPERVGEAEQYFSGLQPNDIAGTLSGMMRYKDVFGESALTNYVRMLNANTRANAVLGAASLRSGQSHLPRTITEEKTNPAKPLDFLAKGPLATHVNGMAVPFLSQNPKWAALPPDAQAALIRQHMFATTGYDVSVALDPQSKQWVVTGGMTPASQSEKTTKTMYGGGGGGQSPMIFNFGNEEE